MILSFREVSEVVCIHLSVLLLHTFSRLDPLPPFVVWRITGREIDDKVVIQSVPRDDVMILSVP